MREEMERREDVRFPTDLPVFFTVLGGAGELRKGRVRDVSQSGMRIATDVPLEPGSFIRLQLEDCILYGEIRYCCPWLGGYVAGTYVERVLLGDSGISQLLAAVLPEANRATVGAVETL